MQLNDVGDNLPVFPVPTSPVTENEASSRLTASGEAIGAVIDALASAIVTRMTQANGQISTVSNQLKRQARKRLKDANELTLPSLEAVATGAAERLAASNLMLSSVQSGLTGSVNLPGVFTGQIIPTVPLPITNPQPPIVIGPVFPPCCDPLDLWAHQADVPAGVCTHVDRYVLLCRGSPPPGNVCNGTDCFLDHNCWSGPSTITADGIARLMAINPGAFGLQLDWQTAFNAWHSTYCQVKPPPITPTPPQPPTPPIITPSPLPIPPPPTCPPCQPQPPVSSKPCATCAECKDGVITKVDQRVAMIPWGLSTGRDAAFGSECSIREIAEAATSVMTVADILDAFATDTPLDSIDLLYSADDVVSFEVSTPLGVPTTVP